MALRGFVLSGPNFLIWIALSLSFNAYPFIGCQPPMLIQLLERQQNEVRTLLSSAGKQEKYSSYATSLHVWEYSARLAFTGQILCDLKSIIPTVNGFGYM